MTELYGEKDGYAPVLFTQFLRPDGTPVAVETMRPVEIVHKARHIVSQGYRFEIEQLSTGDIHGTITNKDGDVSLFICPNGPEVLECIDKMINDFHAKLTNTTTEDNDDDE